MLDSIRFLDKVFSACFSIQSRSEKFTAEAVFRELGLLETGDKTNDYWQTKNATNALNYLEKLKLISGAVRPEFTKNYGFLKEVRYGSITWFGRIAHFLPKPCRYTMFLLYVQKQRIASVLGTLSIVKLVHNAYLGAGFLSDWLGYVAAIVCCYFIYVFLQKTLDSRDC